MQKPSRRQALAGAAGVAAGLGITRTALADDTGTSAAAHHETEKLVSRMSLEQKLGQLFVVEVYGTSADTKHEKNRELYGVDTPAEVIEKYQPGGVIYFDERRGTDNVQEPRQIARLSNGLQRASRVPLIISTDQEGGSAVYRLTDPATLLPGNMALGATRSASDSRESARIIATELASVGINQNYAPDADVNINPANPVIGVRSFGSDPDLCSELVAAGVRGHHRGKVASAAKHFPGHGDTEVDSHLGLPEIDHTREELDQIDLPPFRAAIKRGVDTIMTAHIVVRALDPSGDPATMSRPIVTGLLREELGFDGLIVTDALDMQGASGQFPPDVAPVRALEAGCDQLVLAPELDTAFAAVREAVRSGRVSEERIDESVQRVLLHKRRRGLFPSPYVDEERAVRIVGNDRHQAMAREITDRSVTLVKNDGLLPLSPKTKRSVLVTGWDEETTKAIADAVSKRKGQQAKTTATDAVPSEKQIETAVAAARDSDLVIVSSNAMGSGEDEGAGQAKLVKALQETDTPVLVVAVRNPYDIQRFPSVPGYFATYSHGTPSMEAFVRAAYGEVDPSGKLPVAVLALDDQEEELYPYGHGLRY